MKILKSSSTPRGLTLSAMALSILLAACGQGALTQESTSTGTDTGTGNTNNTTTTTTTTTVKGKMAVALLKTSGASTTSVSLSEPINVRAQLLDNNNAAIANAVVTFSVSDSGNTKEPSALTFVPAATALTDSNGYATLTVKPTSLQSSGAHIITAKATVGGAEVSNSIGVNIGSTTVGIDTVGAKTSSSITAYGTTTIEAKVSTSEVPITVNFTSSCAAKQRAQISASVEAVNGVATATYTDIGCAGEDVITASIPGVTAVKTTTLTVAPPKIANLQFVSATPSNIVLPGTGAASSNEVAIVTFRLIDQAGKPVPTPTNVDFTLSTSYGGIKLDGSTAAKVTKQTDANGEVSVQVQSGSLPTPVWVTAAVSSDTNIKTQSSKLSIATGRPTQERFSLTVTPPNMEGWNIEGTESVVTVMAADRLGSPVPDGTVVNFISEGASIQPTCQTVAGTCSVKFRAQENRPVSTVVSENGRVTIVAYAVGEESFVDLNSNNVYDKSSNESFTDLGYVFIDADENGYYDTGEQSIGFGSPGSQTASCTYVPDVNGNPSFSIPSVPNTCDGAWGVAHVRRAKVVVMSGSTAFLWTKDKNSSNVYVDNYNDNTSPVTRPRSYDITLNSSTCAGSMDFWLVDLHNNPLPSGSTLALNMTATLNLQANVTPEGVSSTTQKRGTYHSVSFTGTPDTTTTPPTCTGSGQAALTVTTPSGWKSSFTFNVSVGN